MDGQSNVASSPENQHGTVIERPAYRRLRGYSFDPSLSVQLETMGINEVVFRVDWEELTKGPVGEYVEVVDFDPASACFYEPVDLNDPLALAQDGLPPSEGNPQFHQQMVYAVAMTTIKNFENSLGRKALWAVHWDQQTDQESIPRLRIYPHALRMPNSYYSPSKEALLFGYFPAAGGLPQQQLPGGIVFTCLSHDVVAHETTHALLDGMHRLYIEPSHPDVLAFHEAFADIVALLQHFTFQDVLRNQIAKTHGDLQSQNLLGELAQQFGQAIGNYGALRDAIGQVNPDTHKWEPLVPDTQKYQTVIEPHARGSILVAAVFAAYLSIYHSRVEDLFRIASGGSGVLGPGALHPDLVNRLTYEAAKSARHVLNMCIRALDYCPPVEITFGDYLRALITADADLMPEDERGYRVAFIEAFRLWGIYPRNVRSLSIESLRWPGPRDESERRALSLAEAPLREFITRLEQVKTQAGLLDENRRIAIILHRLISTQIHDLQPFERLTGLILDRNSQVPGLRRRPNGQPIFEVYGSQPALRVGPGFHSLKQVVLSLVQTRLIELKPSVVPGLQSFLFRGGCTMILNLDPFELRYRIVKAVDDEERLQRQISYLQEMSGAAGSSLRATYFRNEWQLPEAEPLAILHSAILPEEG
jgi:hypothetical protein